MSAFEKRYNRSDLKWQRQREIDFYRKLQGIPHFPDFEAADEEGIYITHCGEAIPADADLDDVERQLGTILDLLEEAGIRHRDITANNLCWKDGVLYLVDFGWSIWEHEEDSPQPVPHVMRPWMCSKTDREQAEATMKSLREKQP